MVQSTSDFFDRLEGGLMVTTAIMLAFIVALTLVQVFFRYVLNNALGWSAELTKIIFIWMTFIGSAVAINRGRHLRIDTFVNRLTRRNQVVVDLIVHVLITILLVVLIRRGVELSFRTLRILTGALRWPRSLLFLPVALGSFFMLVFSIRIIVHDIKMVIKKPVSVPEER